MVALRAALEAELHFGFVGVPALSIGMLAGLGFRYQSVAGSACGRSGCSAPRASGARSPTCSSATTCDSDVIWKLR